MTLRLAGLKPFADPTYRPAADLSKGSSHISTGMSHYVGLVRVDDLPAGVSNQTNLRNANTKTKVSKDVAESLRSNDGEFHLKNKGITLTASKVELVDGTADTYAVELNSDSHDGILDGGHTYTIIQEAKNDGAVVDRQYVFVFIRVNAPAGLTSKMAEGLNKATAVSVGSLANRLNEYAWIKAALTDQQVAAISWRQNDPGVVKAEDLVAILFALQKDRGDLVVSAYASKARALAEMRYDRSPFLRQGPLVRDCFKTHEFLTERLAVDLGPVLGSGVLERGKAPRPRLFTEGPAITSRAVRGVVLPVLSAFRAAIISDQDGDRFDRPYEAIVLLYEAAKKDLLKVIQAEWQASRNDPGAFGKRKETWSAILKVIEAAATANPPSALTTASPRSFIEEQSPVPQESDLLEDWENDLEAIHEQLSDLAESLAATDDPRSRQDLESRKIVLITNKKILEAAIEHVESGKAGICEVCGGPVKYDRLYDPLTTRICASCAGAEKR